MPGALSVGSTDVFERRYTEKFRVFAAQFGEFVMYERDRAARDLGLHLTERAKSGKERVSASLCWFQLKGIQAGTLPKTEADKAKTVDVRLRTEHLLFWYQQPTPTYLVVYVESMDRFLVQNIQKYVADRWGKSILRVKEETATVPVRIESVLDEQAFQIILRKGQIGAWKKLFGVSERDARLCQRDFELIYRVGSAKSRGVEVRLEFINWISKARSEMYFRDHPLKGSVMPVDIRGHWQYMMRVGELEEAYPYLNFAPASPEDDGDDTDGWSWSDDDDPKVTLKRSGCILRGGNCGGEYERYRAKVSLNRLGKKLRKVVSELIGSELVTSREPGQTISVAPWHGRDV